MSNDKKKSMTRGQYTSREQRRKQRSKSDKILNILISIVSILIIANLAFLFTKDDKGNPEKQKDNNENQIEVTKDPENDNESSNTNESESENDESNASEQQNMLTDSEQIASSTLVPGTVKMKIEKSDDPIVEQVITNPNWQPTPTQQTGEHTSVYKEGHIDYEEKLQTIRNAVNLEEDNITYWRVGNNGGSDSSVAVVSSKDQSQKYRVIIEWVENQGWKPVTVEKLKQLEGAY